MKIYAFWRSLATYRVRIALNLKGIVPDEVVDVDLLKGRQHDAGYSAVNPMKSLPTVVDGEGPALFESLAIIEYLDETHPQPPLLPADPRARARVRGLAQIVAGDAHPLVVPRVRAYLTREFKADEAAIMRWCAHWHVEALNALDVHLAPGQGAGVYCHGDQITIADICLASHIAGAGYFNVDLSPFPNVRRIADACAGLDAFARDRPRPHSA